MKRLYFIICLTVFCYCAIAQNSRIPKEFEQLLPLTLSGKIKIINYPNYDEVHNIVKEVDTKEEADIWIAEFFGNYPEHVKQYNSIQDKRCVWLTFNDTDTSSVYFKVAFYNSIYSHILKDYFRIIKFKTVPYGQHGINTKKPNNALLYTKHNPDPDIARYIQTLPR